MLTGNESLWLVGTRAEFLGIDTQITLRFSDNAVVRLESAFSLTSDGGRECLIDPDWDKGHLVPVLCLLHETVAAARIEDSRLIIEFSEGSMLMADPDDDYESWRYIAPEMPPNRIIALPGRDLAIWSSSEVPR